MIHGFTQHDADLEVWTTWICNHLYNTLISYGINMIKTQHLENIHLTILSYIY